MAEIIDDIIAVSTLPMKEPRHYTVTLESKRQVAMTAHSYDTGANVTFFDITIEEMRAMAKDLIAIAWQRELTQG